MGLLTYAYDPYGAVNVLTRAMEVGQRRQQAQQEMMQKVLSEAETNRRLSMENDRRMAYEEAKAAEDTRRWDTENKPWHPPDLGASGSPGAGSMPPPSDLPVAGDALNPDDTFSANMPPAPGVNLYNAGGPAPLSAPLVPPSDTFVPMNTPDSGANTDVPAPPSTDLAPTPVTLQPPDLSAASAAQTGGTGSAFTANPYEPPSIPDVAAVADEANGLPGGKSAATDPSTLMGGPLDQGPGATLKQYHAAQAHGVVAPSVVPGKDDPLDEAKRQTAAFGQMLNGVPAKYAVPAITRFATAAAASASKDDKTKLPDGSYVKGGIQYKDDGTGNFVAVPKPGTGAASLDDMTKGMTFEKDTNTYANADGAKFFVGTTPSGKPKLTPWKPEMVKAKRTFLGTDGQPYSIGTDGQPLQPIPDGVTLVDGKLPTPRTMPDGSLGIVHPDNTVTTIMPAGVKLGDKAKGEYLKALGDAHTALLDLNGTELQYGKKPGIGKDWYGITADTLKEKRDAFDAAQAKVAEMQAMYPQLKSVTPPAGGPAAPAAAPAPAPAAAPAPAPAPAASPAPAATATPPVLTTKAQFDALPSGAEYIRDGKRYRKP